MWVTVQTLSPNSVRSADCPQRQSGAGRLRLAGATLICAVWSPPTFGGFFYGTLLREGAGSARSSGPPSHACRSLYRSAPSVRESRAGSARLRFAGHRHHRPKGTESASEVAEGVGSDIGGRTVGANDGAVGSEAWEYGPRCAARDRRFCLRGAGYIMQSDNGHGMVDGSQPSGALGVGHDSRSGGRGPERPVTHGRCLP